MSMAIVTLGSGTPKSRKIFSNWATTTAFTKMKSATAAKIDMIG